MNLIIVIHKMSSDAQTSWNDPSNADNPQADYSYIPNDTTKEDTSFYHLIPRVFNPLDSYSMTGLYQSPLHTCW